MKKMFVIILTIVFVLICYVPVSAESEINKEDYSTAEKAVEFIAAVEKTNIEVEHVQILYDVEDDPAYLLIRTGKGYAIVSRKNGVVSEYDINNDPFSEIDESLKVYYGGPFTYFVEGEIEKNEFIQISSIRDIVVSDEFRKANKRFLKIENDAKGTTASWTTTIPQSRMSTYSGGYWNNTTNNYPYPSYSQNGICGTISSAVMLAYYDDYVNNNYIPASIRTQYSSSPGTLITTLYSYIDALHPNGTLPSHLNTGIYNFLSNYSYVSTGHQSFCSSGATWATAKSEINAGYPLCIGLIQALGSTYNDHWVVAYQYLDTGSGTTQMYKCVDVNGLYTAAVYVCWSVGEVHMD